MALIAPTARRRSPGPPQGQGTTAAPSPLSVAGARGPSPLASTCETWTAPRPPSRSRADGHHAVLEMVRHQPPVHRVGDDEPDEQRHRHHEPEVWRERVVRSLDVPP